MRNSDVLLALYAALHNQRCSQVQKSACRPSCHRYCWMWAGRGLYRNIIQTVLKHNKTYTDTREILCFLFITFTGATQAVWVLRLHLLPQPDSGTTYQKFCSFFFFSLIIFCWDQQSSKPPSSWLGGLHTPKLNHHLIKSIHIQLTGSVFVQRPRTPDPSCEYIWCSGMKAEKGNARSLCVSVCVTVWRCWNTTVTRLILLALNVPAQILWQ